MHRRDFRESVEKEPDKRPFLAGTFQQHVDIFLRILLLLGQVSGAMYSLFSFLLLPPCVNL